MSILNPNKKYEELFKTIDAKSILKKYSTFVIPTLSIAEFYMFREELLKTICNYSEETYIKLVNSRALNDYRSQFGMFWIIGMYDDTYGVRIKLSETI
jgi:hypothetical protein